MNARGKVVKLRITWIPTLLYRRAILTHRIRRSLWLIMEDIDPDFRNKIKPGDI